VCELCEERPFDPLLADRAWTVCFYSYRGGVGRTTLAVNVARDWHAVYVSNAFELGFYCEGEPVTRCLLVDFDLEAPGVDEFECMRPPDPSQPGLVEYIREYLDRHEDPPLKRFVYAPCGERGPLVMRAGRRDGEYRAFLGRLNWWNFYREHDGDLFLRNLQIAARRELGCGILLVDSRTGHSEIAGVCLGCLADAVVFVFEPTRAHVDGIAQAAAPVMMREEKEERFIPRLYVANKCPKYYKYSTKVHLRKDEVLKQTRNLTLDIVRQCEGSDVDVEVMGATGDDLAYCWLKEAAGGFGATRLDRRAIVTYLPLMVFRRHPYKPDVFLRPPKLGPPDYPDEYIRQVATWASLARAWVADDQQVRTVRKAFARFSQSEKTFEDVATYFHSIPANAFAKLLDANPDWRRGLKRLPADVLARLLPEEHRKILRRWKRGTKLY